MLNSQPTRRLKTPQLKKQHHQRQISHHQHKLKLTKLSTKRTLSTSSKNTLYQSISPLSTSLSTPSLPIPSKYPHITLISSPHTTIPKSISSSLHSLNQHTLFKSTHPVRDMVKDPLNRGVDITLPHQTHHGATWISSRGANKPISVLLAGYNSFFAQHLYQPLQELGFQVIPVTYQEQNRHDNVQSLTMAQIEDQGLPDVDVIINCSGTNMYASGLDDVTKALIETSRFTTNRFWSNQIRATRTKPYVYMNISSALYYPSHSTKIYDEDNFLLPAPVYGDDLHRPDIQAQELSLPYWSRLFRDVEWRGRIFQPENDFRTQAQIDEYLAIRAQYDRSDFKNDVYTNTSNLSPEQQARISTRRDLLTNKDVRCINFRLGHVLAQTMQEHTVMQPWLDNGFLSWINEGDSIHPWIHADDAVALAIHSIFNTDITGPVNAVAPTMATNKELINYMVKSRRTFRHPFGISSDRVDSKLGPVLGSVFHETRKVVPKRALETKFEYMYGDIDFATKFGDRSDIDDSVVRYGGWQNLPRNRGRTLAEGYRG